MKSYAYYRNQKYKSFKVEIFLFRIMKINNKSTNKNSKWQCKNSNYQSI